MATIRLFESGVHRVQRVPLTESKGRVHTSTITVAVLPEVEDVEVDIKNQILEKIYIVHQVLVDNMLIKHNQQLE